MARKSQKSRAAQSRKKKNRAEKRSRHLNRSVASVSSPPNVHDVSISESFGQLDLSDGPFSRLPNELVQSILARLDIQKFIPLQVVCKKWHAVIFSISQKNKSLYLTFYLNLIDYKQGDYIATKSFRLIDLSIFTKIKFNSVKHLPTQFNKLFPSIESVLLDVSCPIQFSLSDFLPVLSQLHRDKLTTLSITFNYDSSSESIVKLLTLISSFVTLKRLDIGSSLNDQISLLGPTLARLEQFSYYTYEPSLVGLFSPNCSRVSLNGFYENINFSQWHSNNAQWLANVTHLELKNVQMHNQHIDSLIVHAVSLQVLRLYAVASGLDWRSHIRMTPQMVGHLSKLKHLTEIDMSRIVFELPLLDRARRDLQLAQLVSLRTCALSIYQMIHFTDFEMDNTESVLFASALSTILPNVQHLNIAVDYVSYDTLQGVQSSLSLFTKLETHSFNYF